MPNLAAFCASDQSTILEVAEVIQRNHCRCALITNLAGQVVGVFSEGDLLRSLLRGTSSHAPVRSLLQPAFQHLSERDLAKASEITRKLGCTLIPVVNAEFQLIDVVTLYDVLDYLSAK